MLNVYFLLFPIPRKSLFHSVNEHDNFIEKLKILFPTMQPKLNCIYSII